jgi:hypothetical protein
VLSSGNTAGAALKDDATDRGNHIDCQQAQTALLGIVRTLIDAGVLTIKHDP